MRGLTEDSQTHSKRLAYYCTDGAYVQVTIYPTGKAEITIGDRDTPELSVELSNRERLEIAKFLDTGVVE
jgi:hypothetical protein